MDRYFARVQLLMCVLLWKCAGGYTRIEQRGDGVVEIIGASLSVASLLQELDQPLPIMTMAHRASGVASDIDCPLTLCNHVKAIILVPGAPRLFVACLQSRQFCGYCPQGTVLQSDDRSFRCIPTVEKWENDTAGCDVSGICRFDFSQRLFLECINETETDQFIICSKKRSFCGFCQSDISIFNHSTLTCDLLFPETNFPCYDERTTKVYPDPLAACSPLAYVCLPGKRRAVTIRCPHPKMRHSPSRTQCDYPEFIPECGGVVRETGNQTSAELELPSNGTQLARSGEPTANCIGHCMYNWYKPKNFCIRFCTN